MILGVIAALAAGLFAGAAVYISLVEHPARVSCGTELAVTEFRPSYRRASVMQASLAVVGSLAAFAEGFARGAFGWVLGGALLAAVVPFTLVVILPTNHRLLDETLDPRSTEAAALLARWQRLHAVRSAASLLAFAVFVVLLARS